MKDIIGNCVRRRAELCCVRWNYSLQNNDRYLSCWTASSPSELNGTEVSASVVTQNSCLESCMPELSVSAASFSCQGCGS